MTTVEMHERSQEQILNGLRDQIVVSPTNMESARRWSPIHEVGQFLWINLGGQKLPSLSISGEPRIPLTLIKMMLKTAIQFSEDVLNDLLKARNVHLTIASDLQVEQLRSNSSECQQLNPMRLELIKRSDIEYLLGSIRQESAKNTNDADIWDESERIIIGHYNFSDACDLFNDDDEDEDIEGAAVSGYLYPSRRGSRCIRCLKCNMKFTPPDFVVHNHLNFEVNVATASHWGLSPHNWQHVLQPLMSSRENQKHLDAWESFSGVKVQLVVKPKSLAMEKAEAAQASAAAAGVDHLNEFFAKMMQDALSRNGIDPSQPSSSKAVEEPMAVFDPSILFNPVKSDATGKDASSYPTAQSMYYSFAKATSLANIFNPANTTVPIYSANIEQTNPELSGSSLKPHESSAFSQLKMKEVTIKQEPIDPDEEFKQEPPKIDVNFTVDEKDNFMKYFMTQTGEKRMPYALIAYKMRADLDNNKRVMDTLQDSVLCTKEVYRLFVEELNDRAIRAQHEFIKSLPQDMLKELNDAVCSRDPLQDWPQLTEIVKTSLARQENPPPTDGSDPIHQYLTKLTADAIAYSPIVHRMMELVAQANAAKQNAHNSLSSAPILTAPVARPSVVQMPVPPQKAQQAVIPQAPQPPRHTPLEIQQAAQIQALQQFQNRMLFNEVMSRGQNGVSPMPPQTMAAMHQQMMLHQAQANMMMGAVQQANGRKRSMPMPAPQFVAPRPPHPTQYPAVRQMSQYPTPRHQPPQPPQPQQQIGRQPAFMMQNNKQKHPQPQFQNQHQLIRPTPMQVHPQPQGDQDVNQQIQMWRAQLAQANNMNVAMGQNQQQPQAVNMDTLGFIALINKLNQAQQPPTSQ